MTTPETNRADRILDAAGELVMRLGSKKVTIDDIAKLADIGKGTVYLHWRTKQELFGALLTREAVIYVEALTDLLRRDPAAVLPHRMIAESYLIVSRRPVLRALITGDKQLLHGRMTDSAVHGHEVLAAARFHEIMTRYGLLRDDLEHLRYGIAALQAGFYLIDPSVSGLDEPDLETRAEALAHIVRSSYEPDPPPGPDVLATAAAELVALTETLIPPYREAIYGTDRTKQE
jgi:AcrR family transcriptional regulator